MLQSYPREYQFSAFEAAARRLSIAPHGDMSLGISVTPLPRARTANLDQFLSIRHLSSSLLLAVSAAG